MTNRNISTRFSRGYRQKGKTTPFFHRKCMDVRRGLLSSTVSIDSARMRHSEIALWKRFFVRGKKFILKRKNLFDTKRVFFLMGRRGFSLAVIMGMVFMGGITHFFGQWVWAEDNGASEPFVVQQRVLGSMTERAQIDMGETLFEKEIRDMVKGYPIEDMIPYIIRQDKRVVAYLIAIAKKESNWGRRIPVYYGENCFNYWGYRGQDEIMGSAGHTCFDTPMEAVKAVSQRLDVLVVDRNISSTRELILWKCGSSCAGHSPDDVAKWISDVDGYYQAVMQLGI